MLIIRRVLAVWITLAALFGLASVVPSPAAAATAERCWKPSTSARKLPGGATLVVPRRAVSSSRARICVTRAGRRPRSGYFLTTDRAKPWSLRVKRGRLRGTARMSMPFRSKGMKTAGLPVSDLATIGYYDARTKAWTPVPTTVDTKRKRLVARITHFSWWDDLWMNASEVSLEINQRAGELFGQRAAAPACSSGIKIPSWAATNVNAGAELPIRTCSEGADGDRVVVQIVNNRPYGLVLSYGKPVNFGWHESPAGPGTFTSAITDALMGPNELYLPPLSRASIGMSRSAFGFALFQASVTGESLFADAINLALDGGGVVPGLKAKTIEKMTSKVTASCSGFIKPRLDGNTVAATIESDFLELLGTAGACAKDVLPALAREGLLDNVRIDELESRLKIVAALRKGAKAVAVAQLASSIATMLRDTQFGGMAANATFSVRSRIQAAGPPPTRVAYQRGGKEIVTAPIADPASASVIVADAGGEITGIAADRERLYWTVTYGNTGIYSSRLDGSDQRVLVDLPDDQYPDAGVLVDGFYYWANDEPDHPTISRVSDDGGTVDMALARPDLLDNGGNRDISDLASDGQHLYFASCYHGGIGRMNLDGTGIESNWLGTGYKSCPQGVAAGGGAVFWSYLGIGEVGKVGRANLDRSDFNRTWIENTGGGGLGIYNVDSDGTHVYWSTGDCNACGGASYFGRATIAGGDLRHRWLVQPKPGASLSLAFLP